LSLELTPDAVVRASGLKLQEAIFPREFLHTQK